MIKISKSNYSRARDGANALNNIALAIVEKYTIDGDDTVNEESVKSLVWDLLKTSAIINDCLDTVFIDTV